MYKILIPILLAFLCSSTQAEALNKYAEALNWQNKWQKIIARQTERYAENALQSTQLSAERQKEVANQLKRRINKSLSWENVGARYIQNIVDSCGTELLDQVVQLNNGTDYSAAEVKQIRNAYRTCGSSAIKKSMSVIYSALSNLPDTAGDRFSKAIGDIVIIREKAFKSYVEKYLDAKGHKAFAQSESGNWNWRSNRTSKEHAVNNALASCQARNLEFENTHPCKVVNLNGKWTDEHSKLSTRVAKSESDIMSNKALKSYREEYVVVIGDKAFAQAENGAWSWRSSKESVDDAKKKALAACRKNNKNHEVHFPCKIINVNSKWRAD